MAFKVLFCMEGQGVRLRSSFPVDEVPTVVPSPTEIGDLAPDPSEMTITGPTLVPLRLVDASGRSAAEASPTELPMPTEVPSATSVGDLPATRQPTAALTAVPPLPSSGLVSSNIVFSSAVATPTEVPLPTSPVDSSGSPACSEPLSARR